MLTPEIRQRVEEVITQIRPYLVADGGDLKLINITDDLVVQVELQGACRSCPMSNVTLKNGVEVAVKKAVPEIKYVEAVNM